MSSMRAAAAHVQEDQSEQNPCEHCLGKQFAFRRAAWKIMPRGNEPSPVQLSEASRPDEGSQIASNGYSGISCSLASPAKAQRRLMLDPTWLILADPRSSDEAVITTVWPLWQVQSLIDRSDPRTLQIGMNAHQPGMKHGEAIAYNPPISTYFTLTLNFSDVKACNEAAVHLQMRRLAIRTQMLQKATGFIEKCQAGQDGLAEQDPPVALESVIASVF
ncbi:unnamed protein product [Durusdinium trenchii]|uniref:Uncharacterized protein n=1 Tax=Durusdinium trenchii TaxID=1381693 RepID=A0ABP0PMF5_9DINO